VLAVGDHVYEQRARHEDAPEHWLRRHLRLLARVEAATSGSAPSALLVLSGVPNYCRQMVIRRRATSGGGDWILAELYRSLDGIPSVVVTWEGAGTLEVESDELGRDEEVRELVEQRLDAISPSWRQHLVVDG
jgi:hypothetical protein